MEFRMIGSAAMACAVVLLSFSGVAGELTKWVCPFSGSVGEGNTIPGACRPFGMVQPGPDTVDLGNPSGYERDQAAIRGFSATHLNGTGCAALGDVVLMPFTGGTDGVDFSSAWNRENERAEPGYYAVKLDRFGTSVEITATERVALFRFTWPDGAARKLLVDGASFLRDAWYAKEGPSIPWSKGAVSADRKEISGGRAFVSWTKAETYYAVRFAEPAASVTALPKDAFEGAGDRWICDFGEGGALEVRVAVSSVSEDGAKANLEEAGGKDFAAVRAEADAEWESYLARATAEGDDEQKRNFYTSLYRLFIQPNNLADVDGRYRGADGEIHVAKDGRYYTTLSLWDTFRAAHPLYTLIASERVPGLVDTFIAHARQHGHLPVWSLWGREAHCMIGMPAIPVLADAWAKGFRGFDAEEALGMMVRSMTASDRCWPKMDWASFWEHGYYPYAAGPFDKGFVQGESVSRTLECAYDWWCIAHFARQIGAEATARKADRYAAAWKEVLDPATGFARGRGPDGSWRTPFDPLENSQAGEFFGDYTEANAWIYTWHVFQDPDGLAERLGGREKALAKLDEFFATKPVRTEKVGGNNDLGGVAGDGQIGQYWHGNEPSHHVAYLYTVWGEPAKAEALVKRICRESYKSSDHGLCGNDDCGQMSAWYVFSMLGLYPFNPCDGGYVLGAPQVPRGMLALPGGKRLDIVADNFGAGPVRAVYLNGRRLSARHVSHADLIEGGELRFVMGEPGSVEPSAELRGFGACTFVEEKASDPTLAVGVFGTSGEDRSRMIAGRFLADLALSYGVERADGARASFRTAGGLGVAAFVDGKVCRIVTGPAAAVERAVAKGAFPGEPVAGGAFPEYMKRMGWGTYGMAGFDNMFGWMGPDGEKDPAEDFAFHLDMDDGKAGPMHFDQWLDPAGFDNSDGLVANQGIPWKARLAEKLGIPTSFRVYGPAGGFDWTLRRFPDFMNRPGDFMVNGWLRYHDIAPHLSWYRPEIHKYIARTVMDGMKKVKTEKTRGWMHPHGELVHQPWYDMHQDYSPAAAKSWRDYLAAKGETPASAERLFGAAAGAYRSWDDVPVPEFAHFSGLLGEVLSLKGVWRERLEYDFSGSEPGWWEKPEEERYPGLREKWYLPETDLSDWGSIEMPGNPEFLRRLYAKQVAWGADGSTASRWFRRDFEWRSSLAGGKRVWFYFYPMSDSSVHTPFSGNRHHRIFFNGKEAGAIGQWGALDVTDLLKEGANTVAIHLHGCWWKGRVFLSTEEPRTYPGLLAERDRLWTLWDDWRRDAKYEAWRIILDGMRQVDPAAPIKYMAPEGFGTELTHRLCLDWGGYPHFTGEGIWFYPWYKRYAKLYGIPASSELAGPSNNEREMRMSTLRVFLEGLDGHEPVFQTQVYTRNPELREFWLSHRNVLRRMGTYDIAGDQVIIYRRAPGASDFPTPHPVPGGASGHAKASVWNWDLGRGSLQSIGQSPLYIDDCGIADGKLAGQTIVIDCGNETITRETVARLREWVSRGGTFVALPFTGRSTLEQADSWPIAALTGCDVKTTRPLGGTVTFDGADDLPDFFRGRSFPDAGKVMDWQGRNHNAYSVELAPAAGVRTLASYENGSAAVTVRRLGLGRVITLGSVFAHDVVDETGIWRPKGSEREFLQALLDFAGCPKPFCETDDALVWGQPYRSNNGLDRVAVLCNFNAEGVQKVKVTLRPGARPRALTVHVPGRDVAVPFAWNEEKGEAVLTLELAAQDVAIVDAETYGGSEAVAYWWNRQQELWRPVEKSRIDFEPYRHGRWKDPTFELAEDARFTTSAPAAGWDRDAAFDDSGWTAAPVSVPYFWGAPAGADVWYRKTFDLDAEWTSGDTVTLVSGQWQGGRRQYLTPTRLILNGHELHGFKTGHYDAFDVTKLLKPKGNVLAFEMKGGEKYAGITGKVYLYRRETPVASLDLTGEWRARKVKIPADWKGRRVRVRIVCDRDTPLGVRINGYVARRHHHGFGSETDVDITGHVRFGEENEISLLPNADGDFDDRPVRLGLCSLDAFPGYEAE